MDIKTDQQIQQLLDDISLSDIEILNIKTQLSINNDKHLLDTYIKLYKMRFIILLTTSEMANFLNYSQKTIGNKLKKIGWEYTRTEAQKIASKNTRDYKQIFIKVKETKAKNALIGSLDEEYVRHQLNIKLSKFYTLEVVTGLNNLSVLDSGKEIDIPIIIFKGRKVFKYAVEVNGFIWHMDMVRKDIKKEEITKKGYKLLYIKINGSNKSKNFYKQLDIQIDIVCSTIINDIEKIFA